MNNHSLGNSVRPSQRCVRSTWRPWQRLFATAAVIVLCAAPGCSEREPVRVKLQSRHVLPDPITVLEIEAQVAGPLAGLRYKWFAVAGRCEPQETDRPKTIFKFLEGVRQDQVSVEVWRDNKKIAQSELKVNFDESLARQEMQRTADVQIEITNIPPAEKGGPNSRSHIGGVVNGKCDATDLVLIYTWAFGGWYIQPTGHATHPLHDGNHFASWTHTGTRYAVLLVRGDYEPLNRLDMIPQPKDPILATAIVDGRPADIRTNTTATGNVPK